MPKSPCAMGEPIVCGSAREGSPVTDERITISQSESTSVAPVCPTGSAAADLFSGGGEMGTLMRSVDWSKTKLGPVETWPKSLRTMLGAILASRFPMFIWWGPELLQLYNDSFRPILRDKHPASLGAPAAEVWAEVWDVAGPMARSVQQGGPATWTEDLHLYINNGGMLEETYFTFSYGPIPGDDGQLGGLLNIVQETTSKVQSERQIRMLHALAAGAGDARSEFQAYSVAAEILSTNPFDLPFVLLYQLNDPGDAAHLVGMHGWQTHSGHAEPPGVALTAQSDQKMWPCAEVMATGRAVMVDDLSARFGPMRIDEWNGRVDRAMILPLMRSGRSTPYALLIVGLSPHRVLNTTYQQFLHAIGDHVMTLIGNARAYELERKRAEALAEIDRAKTTFFSNVSHEFRTPLTLILGPVEDALAHPEKSLQGDDLETVYRSAHRLLRLVNSLLDFARIEAGRLQMEYVATDLATYTVDLASSFRSLIERAGLKLLIDCPPLPEPVYVDPTQWEKIVLNLLSNAFKFTFHGTISVALRWKHDHVLLSVTDTGTGIPADDIGRIFDRFHRVHDAHGRSFEGTGIGLSLVHELVKLHGGTIRVESVQQQGSTFTVSIPTGTAHLPKAQVLQHNVPVEGSKGVAPYVLEASQWHQDEGDAPRQHHAQSQPIPAPGSDHRRRKTDTGHVLVVEDNADMRNYLVRLLSAHYDVRAVGDGYAALDAARAQPPDLVLSDVMMPGPDGIGLLQALRNDPKTGMIPVVLLSARAGEESILQGLETGADDYLRKPFSARELLSRVRTHLEMARLRRGVTVAAEQRKWIESVLDLAPIPLLVLETGTARITFANKEADRMAGGEFPKNVPAERYHEVYHWTDGAGRPLSTDDMPGVRAARGEHLTGVEMAWHTFDGIRTVMVFSDEIPQLYNHPAMVVMAFLDITQLKRTEMDLKAAVVARDEFLSVASHELRTPLCALVLQLASLQKVLRDMQLESLSGVLTRKVDKAVKNTERLSRLIDNLIDVSRIETGHLELHREEVDLAEIVNDVTEQFAEQAHQAGCTLRVKPVPAVKGGWDRLRLEQVLVNLLSNAIKYGAGAPIEVALDTDADKARLTVSDHGIGIAAKDMGRIFNRFERATSIRHYGGLGLGLYITRQIVEAHGGQIHVASAPHQGTTFTIEVPRYAAHHV